MTLLHTCNSAGKLDRFLNSELKQVLCRYIFSKKIERYLEISETNNYVDYNDHTYVLAFLKYEIHTVPIIMPLKIVRAHHDYSIRKWL